MDNKIWIQRQTMLFMCRVKDQKKNQLELTPELVVVCAALCLSTAVPHLTAVLFIVYPKTEVLPLEYT